MRQVPCDYLIKVSSDLVTHHPNVLYDNTIRLTFLSFSSPLSEGFGVCSMVGGFSLRDWRVLLRDWRLFTPSLEALSHLL